ncbi:MAG: hypothetical protein GY953_30690, partial [bacterium]|nr:hypothetical protein [bacterium]
ACFGQTFSGSGTIVHNGTSLEIRSAAAIWNKAESRLTVSMFPFELSREDVAELQKSMPVFLASRKPAAPFAVLELELAPGSTTVKVENIRHCVLQAAWIHKMNHTVSANRIEQSQLAREFPRLAGRLSDGGALQLIFRGSERFPLGDDLLEWEVEVSTVVKPKR